MDPTYILTFPNDFLCSSEAVLRVKRHLATWDSEHIKNCENSVKILENHTLDGGGSTEESLILRENWDSRKDLYQNSNFGTEKNLGKSTDNVQLFPPKSLENQIEQGTGQIFSFLDSQWGQFSRLDSSPSGSTEIPSPKSNTHQFRRVHSPIQFSFSGTSKFFFKSFQFY